MHGCDLLTLVLLEGFYPLGLRGHVSQVRFTYLGIFFVGERLTLAEVMEKTVPSSTAMSIGEESQRLDAMIDPCTLCTAILLPFIPFIKPRKLHHHHL
jgi:hypothetical protein